MRIVGTHFDLTERKQAEAERARTELLARLVFAQEDERRRIAREMHDQFGEQLTALGRGIDALKDACGDSAQLRDARRGARRRSRADSIATSITSSGSCGRRRSTISACARRWRTTSRTGRRASAFRPSCTRRACSTIGCASEAETTLYRIAQEALTNVAKHARAKNVDVILERRADPVLLIVEDDGVGFEPPAADGAAGRGFGLLGMQERAALVGATLEIESTAGKGTTVLRADGDAAPTPTIVRPWLKPTAPLRILLADDHVTVRHGLKLLIDGQPDMKVDLGGQRRQRRDPAAPSR